MKIETSGLIVLLRAYARSAAFSNTEACAKILDAADRLGELSKKHSLNCDCETCTEFKSVLRCHMQENKEVIENQQAEIERLKKTIHHMAAACGNPDANDGLRTVIKIGKEALDKEVR